MECHQLQPDDRGVGHLQSDIHVGTAGGSGGWARNSVRGEVVVTALLERWFGTLTVRFGALLGFCRFGFESQVLHVLRS